MDSLLVLTAIGADRPGLVEALSGAVAAHGGNWLESRMAHLAGRFAGILCVRVPAGRVEALEGALRALETLGLRVVCERGTVAQELFRTVQLDLVGADRPGIVREFSIALARRRINVEELTTECTDAPMAGQPLFKARAKLLLPAGVSEDDLRGDLEAIAHDIMVDITMG
ncbi:MAG: glycine cleavage system protein R [Burkholderiales bacterium]|nr:glycine cleavage system protein R [Burkholderiales bacterium]